MKLNDADKTSITDITDVKIKGQMGNMVPVSDLVKVQRRITENHLQKRPKRVVYVLADMAGGLESPAYAILGMEEN